MAEEEEEQEEEDENKRIRPRERALGQKIVNDNMFPVLTFMTKESTLVQCFELTTYKDSAQVNRFQWTPCL